MNVDVVLPALMASLLSYSPIAKMPSSSTVNAIARAIEIDYGQQCSPSEVYTGARNARIRRIGMLGGSPIILAAAIGRCLTGAQNTAWFVVRVSPNAPPPLLSTFGVAVDVLPSKDVLPLLRVESHVSAYVSGIAIYAYRARHYDAIDSYEIRTDTGVRLAGATPIKFALGASSVRLSGSLWTYTGLGYTFYASKGQRVTIKSVASTIPVYMYLSYTSKDGSAVVPGVAAELDHSGGYELEVNAVNGNAPPRDVRYAFTFAIH
jgi:hypothetical protein